MERTRSYRSVRLLVCSALALVFILILMPMKTHAATNIDEVVISGNSHLVEKQQCTTDGITVTTEPANAVEVVDMYWYDSRDDRCVADSETFILNHYYSLNVVLRPRAGYSFDFSYPDFYGTYRGYAKAFGEQAEASEFSGNESFLHVKSENLEVDCLISKLRTFNCKLYAYNGVKLTWGKITGADGYKVYCNTEEEEPDGEYDFFGGDPVGETTGTSFTVSKLKPGTLYYLRVRPYYIDDKTGEKVEAEAVGKTIRTLKRVNTPKVSKKSSGKVTVRWNNIAGESGYQISKSTKKGKTGTIYTVKTTTGKSKVLNVKRKKTYYYKVRAYRTVDGKKIYAPWSAVKKYRLK